MKLPRISRPGSPVEPVDAGQRTRRQIALRLLPFLFLLYVTNYIDRASVAYAALGMSSDLGLSDRTLGLAAGIFFLGYIALQIPGALMVERWSARRAIRPRLFELADGLVQCGVGHRGGRRTCRLSRIPVDPGGEQRCAQPASTGRRWPWPTLMF